MAVDAPPPPATDAATAKAVAAAKKQGPAGLIVTALGALALIVRYAVWPLGGVPGWVTGGLIGLTMAGLVIEKRRREVLGLRWIPGTSLIVGLLVMALSLGIAWVRPSLVGGSVELVPRALPGFTISLPAWDVVSDVGNARDGRLKVESPQGNGRFVRISWNVADPRLSDEIAAMFASGGGEVAHEDMVTIGGHDATRYDVAFPGGKQARISLWHCSVHGRTHQLWTFLSLPDDELDAVHQDMEDSVVCHLPIEGGMPEAAFPTVTAPEGWAVDKGAETLVLTSPDGSSTLTLLPALPDPQLAPSLRFAPELRDQVLRPLLKDIPFALDEAEVALLGENAPIIAFRGTAGGGETKERLLFATFACHAPPGSVLAIGSVPDKASTTPLEEILKTVGCPR